MVSVALNGGLALIKLATGIAGHSYALVADAVESLSDIFSSTIVWGGIVELMDTVLQTALVDTIQQTAAGVDGALFVEKVLVRKMGPSVCVSTCTWRWIRR